MLPTRNPKIIFKALATGAVLYSPDEEVYFGLTPATADAQPAPRGKPGQSVTLHCRIAYGLWSEERLPYLVNTA